MQYSKLFPSTISFIAVLAAREAYNQLFWLKHDRKAFLGFYVKVKVLNSLIAIADRMLK